MNDFFDQIETGFRDAVRRRAHVPWYRRVAAFGRPRALVVVIAGLIVAAPAIGAVTNWYGLGKPDYFPKPSPTVNAGQPIPATGELLPLRVDDPQGGPPWGLKLVKTTRGDICIQFGRVEDGQLGSLGIDDAWDNDHQFHPFPATSEGWDCGTEDAAGDAFVNVGYTGEPASANPSSLARPGRPQSGGCIPPFTYLRPPGSLAPRPRPSASTRPRCPRGGSRMVFAGLLGPDATSVTYTAPDGKHKTAQTSGPDGAYLLVFPLNGTTCQLYTHSPHRSVGPCGGTESLGGASPTLPGAVVAIHYRDGHTCNLLPSPAVERELDELEFEFRAKVKQLGLNVREMPRKRLLRIVDAILAKHHLTFNEYRELARKGFAIGGCPAVGYVAPNEPHLTAADVESPISVRRLPDSYGETNVQISFIAREPVTSSSSWYEIANTGPAGCEADGSGPIGFGDVRVGQRLKTTVSTSAGCKGLIQGEVGYMQNSGPINEEGGGGGTPGQDGSLIVGRFSFRVR